MDTHAVRKELEQRKEANDGDVVAALDDVLGSVLKDVGEATVKSQQALVQANAALKRAKEIGN